MRKSPRFQKSCKNLSATRADSEALQTQTPGISFLNTSRMALLNTEKCQDLRMAPLLAWLFVYLFQDNSKFVIGIGRAIL